MRSYTFFFNALRFSHFFCALPALSWSIQSLSCAKVSINDQGGKESREVYLFVLAGTQGDDVHPKKAFAKALPVIEYIRGKGEGVETKERVKDFSEVRIETNKKTARWMNRGGILAATNITVPTIWFIPLAFKSTETTPYWEKEKREIYIYNWIH